MKRTLLSRLLELRYRWSKKPWASFETSGVSPDGRVQFTISWNTSFIEQLRMAGYLAETEEEMVQLFFIATRMIPESQLGEEDNSVNSDEHPDLSGESTYLKR